jgi:hypothetical protein
LGELGKRVVDGLRDFVVDSIPDVRIILLPAKVSREEYLVNELGSIKPITFYEIGYKPVNVVSLGGKGFELYEPILTVDGKTIDFQAMIASEQVFGVFLSHEYALATFNWKPQEDNESVAEVA